MNNDNNNEAQKPGKFAWTRRIADTRYDGYDYVPNPPGIIRSALLAVAILFGIIFAASGFHSVDSTERAVVFHSNGSLSILPPGKFQWVTPILNTLTTYDVRDVAYKASAIGISLDLQETTTEVTVLYHPDPLAIQTIHQTLGHDYEGKVVAPAVQGCVKNAVSFYNVEQLTGAIRAKVSDDIRNCVVDELARNHIVPNAVTVTDFDFSKQFNDAVEARAVALQKAAEAKNNLERARFEANQTILQAMAQAESARLVAQSTSGSQGATYICLRFLEKWDGKLPLYGGGGIPCGPSGSNSWASAPAPSFIFPAGAN